MVYIKSTHPPFAKWGGTRRDLWLAILEPMDDRIYSLNLGPQHPSTHGVLSVLLELDGEFIVNADPIIGYGHRGHEKMAENRTYEQFMPNACRIDYLSG